MKRTTPRTAQFNADIAAVANGKKLATATDAGTEERAIGEAARELAIQRLMLAQWEQNDRRNSV